MDIEIRMPDMATTDSAIKILRWLAEPGQPVKRGQVLMEIETDKSTMEVESVAAGTLKEHRAQAGESVFAGQVIAIVQT